jgi:hypothetical protein
VLLFDWAGVSGCFGDLGGLLKLPQTPLFFQPQTNLPPPPHRTLSILSMSLNMSASLDRKRVMSLVLDGGVSCSVTSCCMFGLVLAFGLGRLC